MVNRPPGEFHPLFQPHPGTVLRIHNPIGKNRPTPHREDRMRDPIPLVIHIVQPVPFLLVIPRDHTPHRQPVVTVAVGNIGQNLGGRADGDAGPVPQLPQAALPGEHAEPELAVRGPPGHGPQQVRVDLQHLAHGLGGDVLPGARAGVHREHDPGVEAHSQRGGPVLVGEGGEGGPGEGGAGEGVGQAGGGETGGAVEGALVHVGGGGGGRGGRRGRRGGDGGDGGGWDREGWGRAWGVRWG